MNLFFIKNYVLSTMTKDELIVLSPTAILGYGFPKESFERGMKNAPHVIGVDAGSTDPGPYYLGAGKSFTSYPSVKRDLELIIPASVEAAIPCIIGSAGGAGARPHVEWTERIICEIAKEKGLSFRMAIIYADIDKSAVLKAFNEGRIQPLFPAPNISAKDIENSVRIVAQMGIEPVVEALNLGCQIILCGRCYDPVPFAALAIQLGYDPGLALHMGKILECAAIATYPGSGSDCVIGRLYQDYFELESLNDFRMFTRASAAAHSLYEKADPYYLPGPGGTIDLTNCVFTDANNGRVQISGTQLKVADHYTIKLEGVKSAGYRSLFIAGIRDPILINQIGNVLKDVEDAVNKAISHKGTIVFHVYGKNGVMGRMEQEKERLSHELALIAEVISPTQEESDHLCSFIRSTLLHYGYPGRISTAGNLAMLFSPSDISWGEIFEFNLYHLMSIDNPLEPFPIHIREI